jgi:hypothetical protein
MEWSPDHSLGFNFSVFPDPDPVEPENPVLIIPLVMGDADASIGRIGIRNLHIIF